MIPKKLQDQIDKLPGKIRILVELVISIFRGEIDRLQERIKQLEDQASKNSTNSSKPPSSDGPNKKAKSRRPKTDKKPGGQKGHKGSTLQMSDPIDEVVDHQVRSCQECSKDLSDQKADRIARHQEFDIPPMKMEVTEHRSEVKTCTCGCVNTAFPEGLNRSAQYGSNLKALVVYLQDYQLLPYARTKELIDLLLFQNPENKSIHNSSTIS